MDIELNTAKDIFFRIVLKHIDNDFKIKFDMQLQGECLSPKQAQIIRCSMVIYENGGTIQQVKLI